MFIGLVTHPATGFPEAQGANGLMMQLSQALNRSGVAVTCAVEAENRIQLADLSLDPQSRRKAIRAEMAAERRWAKFLYPNSRAWSRIAWLRIRELNRILRGTTPKALQRLANIEAAHLELLRQASASRCHWVLVLEDDATASNINQLAADLVRHCTEWLAEPNPQYVNMSASFSLRRLRVTDLEVTRSAWNAESNVIHTQRPITNTVCAILYRGSFLEVLLPALEAIPMEPIIPIDWKLNVALMNLFETGEIDGGSCLTIDPAPIRQGSMTSSN